MGYKNGVYDGKPKEHYRAVRDDYREPLSPYKKIDETRPSQFVPDKPEYDALREKEVKVISSRMIQPVGPDRIKTLNLISSEVIGGIFDRVNFLQARIGELRSNIDMRKQIHASITKEIEADIDDRNQFMQVVSDINEKRNLKLDVSVLRKERRNEDVQFWRDLVELETELRKMEEEFEVESKIAGIFGNGVEKE